MNLNPYISNVIITKRLKVEVWREAFFMKKIIDILFNVFQI